jgi:uncharacterized repeat protein (TIGR03843 family)
VIDSEVLTILGQGTIRLEGQFLWGSNYTFLAQVEHPLGPLRAVYKPQAGERPLWDFPDGSLASREVAAWLLSEALGWRLVPPTVLRHDGPAGPGSLQQFLDIDPERHYFTFDEVRRARLRPAAVFDVLVNNADRKGGHILLDARDHIWLIDHGVCFHQEPKLRTVIWDFAGEPIPEDLLGAVQAARAGLQPGAELATALAELLEPGELAALRARAEAVLRERRFPLPGPGRPYPWPLV